VCPMPPRSPVSARPVWPPAGLARSGRALARGLVICALAATAPAARAAFGELRRVASELEVPAGWVILAQERNPLAADELEEAPWRIMDTTGAPPGIRISVLCVSPVPEGWTLVGRHEDRSRGDHYLEIQAPVPVDAAPEAPDAADPDPG